jgi:hypothetical protein
VGGADHIAPELRLGFDENARLVHVERARTHEDRLELVSASGERIAATIALLSLSRISNGVFGGAIRA